jgi:hypothetical protein
MAECYSWIGSDHPPNWLRVGSIDVADPDDVRWAIDRGFRIGEIYDGKSFSVAEPCAADIYEELDDAEAA